MNATLVFLHGRAQEFRDPTELQRSWWAALGSGLVRADRSLPDGTQVVMPFYGNLLYALTARLGQDPAVAMRDPLPEDPDEPGPLHPHLPPEVGRVERLLLADMAAASRAGAARGTPSAPGGADQGWQDILGWGPAREALLWLARHTHVDQEILSRYLRDVAVYLTQGREQVLGLVRDGLPVEGPLVLVAHSLGTVVARDLLHDAGVRARTHTWVTFGSPLGIEAVQHDLLDRGTVNPGLDWTSVYDVNDVVALGHPLRPTWGAPLLDLEVENGPEPHSIESYLAHPEAATCVAQAAHAAVR